MITNIKTKLIATATLLLLGTLALPVLAQGKTYEAGLHYFEIEGASAVPGDTVEVVEAFSYMCTHCNTFEPYMQSWLRRKPEHVEFRRIPVVFGRQSWELYARAYVTAEMLGIAEEAHTGVMDRIWKEREPMRTMDELAAFYADFGADPDQFIATSESFAVDAALRKGQRTVQEAGVRGTPCLLVAGKYRIQGSAAVPSFDVMLDIVDFLVEKEAAALATSGEPEAEPMEEASG